MRHQGRLALLVVIATMVIALAAASASARRFEISNASGGFRIVWASLEFEAGGQIVRCEATVEGSFHSRTISKVARQLIAYVNRARINEIGCAGGLAIPLTEMLPWHIQFASFTGTLPNISTIKFRLVGWKIALIDEPLINECLIATSETSPGVGIAELAGTGSPKQITGFSMEEHVRIKLGGTMLGCANFEAVMKGRGTVSEAIEPSTRLLVALVQ